MNIETRIESIAKHQTNYLIQILNQKKLSFIELSVAHLDNLQGIYFVYDNNELFYIGKTVNVKRRLKEIKSNQHSVYLHLFNEIAGSYIYEKFGRTNLFKTEINELKRELRNMNNKEFDLFKKIDIKIQNLEFQFFPCHLHNFRNLEHFAISILDPWGNQ